MTTEELANGVVFSANGDKSPYSIKQGRDDYAAYQVIVFLIAKTNTLVFKIWDLNGEPGKIQGSSTFEFDVIPCGTTGEEDDGAYNFRPCGEYSSMHYHLPIDIAIKLIIMDLIQAADF